MMVANGRAAQDAALADAENDSVLLWVKALHIVFMVSWFAGLFYLPRLFVNHVLATEDASRAQFVVMQQKLYRFVTPFAWLTVVFGLWLLLANWDIYRHALWMHLKLALVAVLIAYHACCGRFVRVFAAGRNTRGHVFYRWFNEFPVLILFGVVILVVVRPF